MTFEVLLFGPLSARLGRSSVELQLHAGDPTCGKLREAFAARHPDAAPLLASHRFARNQEMVADDVSVTPDDEIALIGMVSGG